MAQKTEIGWTETVWNPISGCTKVSAGCKFCYAESIAKRFWKGRKFTDVQFHEDRLYQPLRWRKPKMVFVNSMSDLFHESIPFEQILRVFDVMCSESIINCRKCLAWDDYMYERERYLYAQPEGKDTSLDLIEIRNKYKLDDFHEQNEDCFLGLPRHTYQILTKRPERVLEFFKWLKDAQSQDYHLGEDEHPLIYALNENNWALPDNIWMGVSCEDQEQYVNRGIIAKHFPAKVKFLSLEPLLTEIWLDCTVGGLATLSVKDWQWVIVGCESGAKKRDCDLSWIHKIEEECISAEVPVFVKQIRVGNKVVKDSFSRQEFPKL